MNRHRENYTNTHSPSVSFLNNPNLKFRVLDCVILSPNMPFHDHKKTHDPNCRPCCIYAIGTGTARNGKAGTRVRLVRNADSYCVVQSETGITAHVATSALKLIKQK